MAILQKNWHQPYTAEFMTGAGQAFEQSQAYLYLLKEGLLSHPTSPWTVIASASTSGFGTSDYWDSRSSLTRGTNDTNPGSWIILRSPGVPPMYLRLEWTDSSIDYRQHVWMSPSPPDLSSLSVYRVPEFTGPSFGSDSLRLFNSAGSGSYFDLFSMVAASDGSFIVVNPTKIRQYAANQWSYPGSTSIFFFNRLRNTNPLDPYGCVFGSGDNDSSPLNQTYGVTWNGTNIYTLHPDGTQVECAAMYPRLSSMSNAHLLWSLMDDPFRNWKPLAMPIPIVSVTAGKESKKGELEDMWWGALGPAFRFGQPGFEGEDMVVMQQGGIWMPCFEPYRY